MCRSVIMRRTQPVLFRDRRLRLSFKAKYCVATLNYAFICQPFKHLLGFVGQDFFCLAVIA